MGVVRSLGYVVISATDVDAWERYAVDLLGLQVAERTQDRLLLRMDEYAYRVAVQRGDTDRVTVLGWEVAGPRELDELAGTLTDEGYAVQVEDGQAARARRVSGLVSFDDPDGTVRLELFYGLAQATERYVSPTGAQFVTGIGGLGHTLQRVTDTDRYRRLYEELLGFRVSDYIDDGRGAVLNFLHCNPRHHSFAYAAMPGAAPSIGHLMLEVTDLDTVGRAYDKALAGAAPILSTLGRHTNDKMVSFYTKTPGPFGIEYGYGGVLIDDETWTPSLYDAAHYWGHDRGAPVNRDETTRRDV